MPAVRSLLVLVCLAGSARAQESVDYLRDIKPILSARCWSCHGGLKQESGLRLDTAVLAREGGEGGPAIVAGNSAGSLLVQALMGENGFSRMPLDAEPLADEQIALIARWIDSGAAAPDEPVPPDPRQHWAFQPTTRPTPPTDARGWSLNPIDAFVAAQHAAKGLAARPAAPRHVLLRRVYLDLMGVPPSRGDLRRFLADTSPDAYERVVDRLLASPLYGQRWGRHWMDVWRYSDWAGFADEIRESQRHIWRWRDWIVDSLNRDRPYNAMIVDMLAADEAAPTDETALAATGFLGRNWFKFNRNAWLDNTVEHTGKAFLGVTLNCARCHDHKFDPISQEDYYRFRALFEPYDVRTDRVPGQADLLQDGLPRVYDANAATPTFLFARGDEKHPQTDRPLSPGVPAALGQAPFEIASVNLPATAFYPALRPFVQQESLAAAAAAVAAAHQAQTAAETALADARARHQTLLTAAPPAAAETLPQPAETAPPPIFLSDDFSQPRPELWTPGDGEWAYRDGRLVQSKVGASECRLLSKASAPQDFAASFRLKITGGQMWKSVGLSFDVTSDAFHSVYLSAYTGGPKVQVYHLQNGAAAYPPEAARALPVNLGQEYTLKVEARGQLINVSVDGQRQLAWRMPHERQAGQFAVWTFDAAAEFLSVEVSSLAADAPLDDVAPASGAAPPPDTVAGAEAAVLQAEAATRLAARQAAAAESSQVAMTARIAADNARYANPPTADAEALAQAAAQAQAQAAVCQAEEQLTLAENELAPAQAALKADDEASKQALAAAEAKLKDAQAKLDAARAALAMPAPYSPLDTVYPAASTGRRLALARWIASAENPLTARAAVNQMWLKHFGEGIVASVFDLGLQGTPPTHPELLDWLATELVAGGWSMKRLHRLMVTSNTYRMDSTAAAGDPNLALDRDNRYLWRMRSRRMEAEIIRDSVLAATGQLDAQLGGPEIDQNAGQTSRRRSLYFRHAPEKQMTFLMLFDAPSVVECYRRNESVAPQQALALANSPLALNHARRLAAQVSAECGTVSTAGLGSTAESGDTPHARAQFAASVFEHLLCRPPTPAEQAACEEFLLSQAAGLAAPATLNAFTTGPAAEVKPAAEPHLRARENLVHVLLNHHEFVTIR